MARPANVIPDPVIAANVRARLRADGGEQRLADAAGLDGLSVIRVAAEMPVRRSTLAVVRAALASNDHHNPAPTAA